MPVLSGERGGPLSASPRLCVRLRGSSVLSGLGKAVAIALPLLVVPRGVGAAAPSSRVPALAREARALEAELAMAGKLRVYFVLDARNSRLVIKAAGLTLKAMPISYLKAWGDAVPARPHVLLGKTALLAPHRPTIRPPAKSSQDSETSGETPPAQDLDALELDDMPCRFRLTLTNGIGIAVRPEPEGPLSGLREWAYSLAWHLARPLPTLWSRIRGRPYTSLYVQVAASDARALYWALADGSELLLSLGG